MDKILDELIKEMEGKMKNRDLSDEYLRENGLSTREEIGIGEYSYGITMIPCSWVYNYLLKLQKLLSENKKKGLIK